MLLRSLLEVYQGNFCSIATMMGNGRVCLELFLKCVADGFSLQAHITDDWFGPSQTQRKKQNSNSRRKNQNGRKDASSHNVTTELFVELYL